MVKVGYMLSSEEHPPLRLVELAGLAEGAGFEALCISDHFHPWNQAQGQAAFVWGVLGGISKVTERVGVATAVTCPTVRLHPAVVAQAAATAAAMLPGRFALGLGTGEALNEHIFGDAWPEAAERREMLEEAVQVIRELWSGRETNHRGAHYRVSRARLYTLPEQPPPILVSGFGEESIRLAGRIGDGFFSTKPLAEHVDLYRRSGGAGKRAAASVKVCWSGDEARARHTAHRLWATDLLGGELAQVLPTPAHLEAASENVTEEMVAGKIACGPDPERHLEAIRPYLEAGYDEIYVSQVGPEQEGFFDFYSRELLPRLRG